MAPADDAAAVPGYSIFSPWFLVFLAAGLGSRHQALGREGEEEAAGRCTGSPPADLGAAGLGAASRRRISGGRPREPSPGARAERGRERRRPPGAAQAVRRRIWRRSA